MESFLINPINYFKCPLTDLVYLNPVVADDGYIYEEMAISYWLVKEGSSPITNESISDTLIPIKQYKNIVEEFLKNNPDQMINRFGNKKPYYLFRDNFIDNLLSNKFNELVLYTDALLTDFLDDGETIGQHLFINCKDDEIIKSIINNSIDYNSKDDCGNRLIHFACQYSNQNIIKFLIEKGVDIQYEDNNNNKAIHYILMYQKQIDLIIDYFINNKNESHNSEGLLPIHIVCKHLESWETLEPFLNNNYDLNIPSLEKLKPIHYVCKYGKNAEVIKRFIDLNVNLEADIVISSVRMTPDQLLYINNNLTRKQKQDVVRYYLNKLFRKPDIVDDYFDNDLEPVDSVDPIDTIN